MEEESTPSGAAPEEWPNTMLPLHRVAEEDLPMGTGLAASLKHLMQAAPLQ